MGGADTLTIHTYEGGVRTHSTAAVSAPFVDGPTSTRHASIGINTLNAELTLWYADTGPLQQQRSTAVTYAINVNGGGLTYGSAITTVGQFEGPWTWDGVAFRRMPNVGDGDYAAGAYYVIGTGGSARLPDQQSR